MCSGGFRLFSPSFSAFSSPAKAGDVLRADGTGEAVPERSEAEQPMDHEGSVFHLPLKSTQVPRWA